MIIKSLQNLVTASEGARVMDRSPTGYKAFALGAESWHSELDVVLNGESYRVGIGRPVILPEPFDGQPVLQYRRPTFQEYRVDIDDAGGEGFASRAQVLGLECLSELAAVPRDRNPWVLPLELELASAAAGADTNVLVIPFQGRRHAVIYVQGATADDVKVYGVRYHNPLTSAIASLTTVIDTADDANDRVLYQHDEGPQSGAWDFPTIGASTAIHVGGTNEEEAWDEILVSAGDGSAIVAPAKIAATCFGELGR